jgi:hypothetical protein
MLILCLYMCVNTGGDAGEVAEALLELSKDAG